jgi:hypothetical protein
MYCIDFILVEHDRMIVRLSDTKGWAMSYVGYPSWVKHRILIEQDIRI